MIKPREYWFTIASNTQYLKMAKDLARSLEMHNISIDILGDHSLSREESKYLKIAGILDAPSDCDRIVFLDADTIVTDPTGTEKVNGSWQIPWRIESESSIPKNLDFTQYTSKLEQFYKTNGFFEFTKGQKFEGIEWNSGVIIGDRDIMTELAREWAIWWNEIKILFDGNFRRDQISYRMAYLNIFKKRYQLEDLPADYNWIVSYSGINPNANIIHRTMVKNIPWMENGWINLIEKVFEANQHKTHNKIFDLSNIQDAKPCLHNCRHHSEDVLLKHLKSTIKQQNPEKLLVYCANGINNILYKKLKSLNILSVFSGLSGNNIITEDFDLICFDTFNVPDIDKILNSVADNSVGCITCAHHLWLYQALFQFSYVRFIDYSFVIFSNNEKIMNWCYHE